MTSAHALLRFGDLNVAIETVERVIPSGHRRIADHTVTDLKVSFMAGNKSVTHTFTPEEWRRLHSVGVGMGSL